MEERRPGATWPLTCGAAIQVELITCRCHSVAPSIEHNSETRHERHSLPSVTLHKKVNTRAVSFLTTSIHPLRHTAFSFFIVSGPTLQHCTLTPPAAEHLAEQMVPT